jgi:hypothetical protein
MRFFFTLSQKQLASCFRPPSVLMYTSLGEAISSQLLAKGSSRPFNERPALPLRADGLP